MLKKILSTFLMIILIFSCFNVSALDASIYTVTNRVNVHGLISEGQANCPVTLLMINKSADVQNLKKSDVAYVMQGVSNENGEYDFRFSFDCTADDISQYKVIVNSGGKDVSDTILRAAAFSDLFDINLNMEYDIINAKLSSVIDNVYSVTDAECTMIIAFYSEKGELLDMKIDEMTQIKSEITQKSLLTNVPVGTSRVSGFLWSDLSRLVPMSEKIDDDTVDLLIIGSSVGRDSVDHLHNLAAADGVQLNVMNIYRGNGRFQQMYESIVSDTSSAYTFYFNNDNINGRGTEGLMTIKEALQYRDWDYISLQQGAWAANNYDSFNSQEEGGVQWFDEILKTVRTIRPESEIVLHMTWAHENGRVSPEDGKSDETVVFGEIVDTYTKAAAHAATLYTEDGKCVSLNGQPLRLIPNAEAFYSARNSEGASFYSEYNSTTGGSDRGPSLFADGRHASTLGKLLAASVWYEALTGNKCEDNTYYSQVGISDISYQELAGYAHAAVVKYGWQSN